MRKITIAVFVMVLCVYTLPAQDWIIYEETFGSAGDESNWGTFVGTNGFTSAAHNTTEGVGGGGAIKFTDGGFGFNIERPITATIGEDYILTMDVQTSGWDDQVSFPIYVSVVGIDDEPKLVYINNSTSYQSISIGGTATGTSGHIVIVGSNASGTNSVWLDNVNFSVNQTYKTNEIYDDSFGSSGDESNWGSFVGTNGFTSAAHNTTEGVGGGGALKFTDGGFGFNIERPITATIGEDYLLTMDVQTSGWDDQVSFPIYVSVVGIDDNPKLLHINNSTSYKTITIGGTATGTSGHIVIVGSNASGTNNVWVDNASFNQIDIETVIFDGGSWNNTSGPSASDNVLIDGALAISGDLAVDGIEVTGSGSLTVQSGASLAIMGNASGNATIQRNTTGNAGYSIVGSPVEGNNLSTLAADYLYTYNGSAWSTPSGATTMIPGTGYFAGYDATSPSISLTGAMVSGNQSVGIATTGDGFNIIANPYSAAISADDLIASDGSNVTTGSLYLWDDGGSNSGGDRNGTYVVANAMNTGVNVGSIQGFFVEAQNGGSLQFTPAMQVTTAGANADGNYYKGLENMQVLELTIEGNKLRHNTTIGYVEGATTGMDYALDATYLQGSEDISFYSLQGEERLATQGLPHYNGKSMDVDLGMSLAKAGDYILSVKRFEGFDSTIPIALLDTKKNKYYQIHREMTLSFYSDAVTDMSRFKVILGHSAILAVEELNDKITIHGSNSALKINYSSSSSELVSIYTFDGRVVFDQQILFKGGEAILPIKLAENLPYILKINDQSLKFLFK